MSRAILYLLAGTVISFLFNYFLLGGENWSLELYNAVAFGLGWGLAYFVDRPEWSLTKKLGISFLGIVLLIFAGLFLFSLEEAVPAVIKFSTVFVAYYLIASLRPTKSLRK